MACAFLASNYHLHQYWPNVNRTLGQKSKWIRQSSIRLYLKCRLQNGGDFISASISQLQNICQNNQIVYAELKLCYSFRFIKCGDVERYTVCKKFTDEWKGNNKIFAYIFGLELYIYIYIFWHIFWRSDHSTHHLKIFLIIHIGLAVDLLAPLNHKTILNKWLNLV